MWLLGLLGHECESVVPKIGLEQDLLFFDELSPGSCFFLPHGCRIYNSLIDIIRAEYFARGYTEVVTPNMYNLKLWETSGHAAKYKENMFCFPIEGQEFGLKPMNCPGRMRAAPRIQAGQLCSSVCLTHAPLAVARRPVPRLRIAQASPRSRSRSRRRAHRLDSSAARSWSIPPTLRR